MRIATYLSCLLLALLLPASLLASGRSATTGPSRIRPEFVADPAHVTADHLDQDGHSEPGHLHTQGLHLHSSGNLPGTGGPGPGAHAFFILPGAFLLPPGCSKSFLRLRLRSTMEHFIYQQRLALYPKHSFW